VTKRAVKQVDRLFGNDSVNVWDSFARWVPHQIAGRPDVLVATGPISTMTINRRWC
jgi:hypothetical protein